MIRAFVLLNSKTGEETTTYMHLKELPEVKEIHMLYGVYDIILLVQAESTQNLKDVISLKIRRIKNIETAITMIIL